MFKGQTVAVVIPAFNEEGNINRFIQSLIATGLVDEIIAVDNCSTDATASEIKRTSAQYLFEEIPGYGSALIAGLNATKSDLVFTVEPDGTFEANDIHKFLAYSDDFDVVLGTRTTQELIWNGAYMPRWVRFGNWFCAKLIEVLFVGPSLSDVGCTFKLINREALNFALPICVVKGSHFSPEFMINCLRSNKKVIEIPVNYKERVGKSKITGGNVPATIKLGIRMLFFIIFRFAELHLWRRKDGK
jgi:glycosyltransferase involved in cell wall biosynthesis